MSLSIGTAWNETAAFARREALSVFTIAFLLLALPAAILQLIAPVTAPGRGPEPGLWMLFLPVPLLASLLGALAISRLALCEGESVRAAFAASLKSFLPLLGAALLVALGGAVVATGIGLLATAVATPGISILLFAIPFAFAAFFWARLILLTPAAAVELIGPIQLIRRSWALSAGNAWRLLGLVLVASTLSLLALIVAGAAGAIAMRLAPGQPQPGAIAMVLTLLVSALLQAAIGGLITLFVARLYAQCVAGR